MKKKTIALMLVMMMVFGITVGGTIAYLTDSKTVTNTFTVGNVKIALVETKVDEYGAKLTGNDAGTTAEGNKYKLIPGHTYTKDPTVTVEQGSEPSYVRMLVTITDATDVKAVLGNDFLPQNFVGGWDATVWATTNTIVEKDNSLTYEFRYTDTVDARNDAVTLDALFDTFTMPNDISNENLAKLTDMEIKVVAHAIQAGGFETAEEAWDAWN